MNFEEPREEWECPHCDVTGDRSEGEFFIEHREEAHSGLSSLASLEESQ